MFRKFKGFFASQENKKSLALEEWETAMLEKTFEPSNERHPSPYRKRNLNTSKQDPAQTKSASEKKLQTLNTTHSARELRTTRNTFIRKTTSKEEENSTPTRRPGKQF